MGGYRFQELKPGAATERYVVLPGYQRSTAMAYLLYFPSADWELGGCFYYSPAAERPHGCRHLRVQTERTIVVEKEGCQIVQ